MCLQGRLFELKQMKLKLVQHEFQLILESVVDVLGEVGCPDHKCHKNLLFEFF